jgi:hypothetical protein
MSALKQVFVRIYLRYEQDWYAEDLERFAALWAARVADFLFSVIGVPL